MKKKNIIIVIVVIILIFTSGITFFLISQKKLEKTTTSSPTNPKEEAVRYYGIFFDDFNAERFLNEYFDNHPNLDRSLFNQLMKKELRPCDGYHITLVHENDLKESDKVRSEPARARVL